ncbi:hypothetical protein Nepgr_033972 [Nepenthes gracilis]|uniref:Uncharacterized protein n=1 Tax=Nepenthes gracilis TaxID=150966 RepID=A0AAD3Y7C3_NEPGR|nr:hypothetical protein Nepgr_033972 [Nepenthes gracilis]
MPPQQSTPLRITPERRETLRGTITNGTERCTASPVPGRACQPPCLTLITSSVPPGRSHVTRPSPGLAAALVSLSTDQLLCRAKECGCRAKDGECRLSKEVQIVAPEDCECRLPKTGEGRLKTSPVSSPRRRVTLPKTGECRAQRLRVVASQRRPGVTSRLLVSPPKTGRVSRLPPRVSLPKTCGVASQDIRCRSQDGECQPKDAQGGGARPPRVSLPTASVAPKTSRSVAPKDCESVSPKDGPKVVAPKTAERPLSKDCECRAWLRECPSQASPGCHAPLPKSLPDTCSVAPQDVRSRPRLKVWLQARPVSHPADTEASAGLFCRGRSSRMSLRWHVPKTLKVSRPKTASVSPKDAPSRLTPRAAALPKTKRKSRPGLPRVSLPRRSRVTPGTPVVGRLHHARSRSWTASVALPRRLSCPAPRVSLQARSTRVR